MVQVVMARQLTHLEFAAPDNCFDTSTSLQSLDWRCTDCDALDQMQNMNNLTKLILLKDLDDDRYVSRSLASQSTMFAALQELDIDGFLDNSRFLLQSFTSMHR